MRELSWQGSQYKLINSIKMTNHLAGMNEKITTKYDDWSMRLRVEKRVRISPKLT